jgi:hypothetical protein
MRRPEPAPAPEDERPAGPSLTVVGAPFREPAPEPDLVPETVPEPEPEPAPEPDAGDEDFPAEAPAGIGTPAGARLLATQMAVSGSSREEIEARLRSGFAITDTRPILDAILGPEK